MHFLEVRCQDGVSHKIRWGAQGVSRVVTGKSGSMHVWRGSASLLSSHGRGIGPQDALKKDSRGLSSVQQETLCSLDSCR